MANPGSWRLLASVPFLAYLWPEQVIVAGAIIFSQDWKHGQQHPPSIHSFLSFFTIDLIRVLFTEQWSLSLLDESCPIQFFWALQKQLNTVTSITIQYLLWAVEPVACITTQCLPSSTLTLILKFIELLYLASMKLASCLSSLPLTTVLCECWNSLEESSRELWVHCGVTVEWQSSFCSLVSRQRFALRKNGSCIRGSIHHAVSSVDWTYAADRLVWILWQKAIALQDIQVMEQVIVLLTFFVEEIQKELAIKSLPLFGTKNKQKKVMLQKPNTTQHITQSNYFPEPTNFSMRSKMV